MFTSIGNGVRGLLGKDAFLDHLAQAQALANGDPMTAARTGRQTRSRGEKHPKVGQIAAPDPGSSPIVPKAAGDRIVPDESQGRSRRLGLRWGGFGRPPEHLPRSAPWKP